MNEIRKASDKEENTSASVILEELNTFSGILFAATNFITTIDPAMYRRFLMKIEFPVPGRDVLAKIWRAKLPWITAEDAEALAERFHLAGAVIDKRRRPVHPGEDCRQSASDPGAGHTVL